MLQSPGDYGNLLKRYSAYAPVYDRLWGRYSAATLGKALEIIPADGDASLLDVACGTGLLAGMLRKAHPGLRITGIDISADMLKKARQRIPPGDGVTWRVGSAESIPLPDNQFDVLTCTNAFHLVQDPFMALGEFRRVLRPGGALVLVDWCRDYPVMQLRGTVLRIADKQRRQIRRLSELADLLRQCGFDLASADRFRAGLWGLMCVVARSRAVKPASVSSDPVRPAIVVTRAALS